MKTLVAGYSESKIVAGVPKAFRTAKRASTKVIVDADVREFVSNKNSVAEFEELLAHAKRIFNDSIKMTCRLVESLDEPGGEPRILIEVKSNQSRNEFAEAEERFYSPLRSARLELYPYVVVTRDL